MEVKVESLEDMCNLMCDNVVPEKVEMVNHPKHYNIPGRKECIDEMVDIFGEENTVIWAIMTAYKYGYRIGNKDEISQEQGKIDWYEAWAENHNSDEYERAQLVLEGYIKSKGDSNA